MDTSGAIAVVLGALVVAAVIMAYPRLRARFREPPVLAAKQRERLFMLLPWADLLNPRQRERLAFAAAQMLSDVRFIGCNQLRVTPDMRLAIAGQASLLYLGAHPSVFDLPGEILIYPNAFYVAHTAPNDAGLVDDAPMLASGEAWDSGRIVLSWADILAALDGADHNVVLHEFAHLLDFAAPAAPGAPPLADCHDWSQAFGAAFEALRAHGSPVLDIYAAESPAEFFAVAVEAFFQRGPALADAHPAIHALLAGYFDIDTAPATPRFGNRTIPG